MSKEIMKFKSMSSSAPSIEEFRELSFTDRVMHYAHLELYFTFDVLTSYLDVLSAHLIDEDFPDYMLDSPVYGDDNSEGTFGWYLHKCYACAWETLESVGKYTEVKVTLTPRHAYADEEDEENKNPHVNNNWNFKLHSGYIVWEKVSHNLSGCTPVNPTQPIESYRCSVKPFYNRNTELVIEVFNGGFEGFGVRVYVYTEPANELIVNDYRLCNGTVGDLSEAKAYGIMLAERFINYFQVMEF